LHGEEDGSVGFRLVTNRDELRTRPAATPPEWHELRDVATGRGVAGNGVEARVERAVYPVDPVGGGTWIASSPTGLVLCLLNANPIPPGVLPPSDRLLSRGLIIPRLMASASPGQGSVEVMGLLERFELGRFAPFRLIGVSLSEKADRQGFLAVEASWNRRELTVQEHAPGPACFVSSGLGDPLVKPRIKLFNETVRAADVDAEDMPGLQDEFHRHVWEDRPEISVLMNRRDARTVSISTVEVVQERRVGSVPGAAELRFEYEAVAERTVATGAVAERAKPQAEVHVRARVGKRVR